jgi:protein-S-isoprenylcysteine O-methyltransferase Ste14
VGIGSAVGASAIWAMRVSHVKMTPEPGHAAELCQRGIYRFIRHPMYSGLLLAMTMFAVAAGGWMGGLLWAGLAAVLWGKLSLEERLWSERDPAYREYMKRTRRLVPFLF